MALAMCYSVHGHGTLKGVKVETKNSMQWLLL